MTSDWPPSSFYFSVADKAQFMSNTTYRMKISGGATFRKSAQSAGEAIFAALHKHPGQTVVECYSGMTDEDAQEARRSGIDKAAIAGLIHHDIPPHKPVEAEREEA